MSSVCAESRQRQRIGWRKPGAFAVAKSLLALVHTWRQRRRARRQLAAMSERELQDIGTCWPEVAYETAKPFWQK